MRIGYFVSEFPYREEKDLKLYSSYGGSVVVAYNLALSMTQRGNEVKVFTRSSKGSKDSLEEYDNTHVYRYRTDFGVSNYSVSLNLLLKPMKHDVDIIHAHSGGTPFTILSSLSYRKAKRKPLIVTYHGDFYLHGGVVRRTAIRLYNKLQDRVLSCADIIISPSEHYITESPLLRKYGGKTIVIPNGIDIDKFDIPYAKEESRKKLGLPLNKKLLLFLGGIHAKKGPDVLVKAMPKVVEEIPDVNLVFAGEGIMKGEIERLAKQQGLTNFINFAGFVREEQKPFYYKAADIFVLPSLEECFPIVNLEAMACGVPIIASDVGGNSEAIRDGETGLLVPLRDSEALANAIVYLLKSEDVREKMGKKGRKKVEDYSWGRIAEETEKVYERLA